jgi:hypothetical protein
VTFRFNTQKATEAAYLFIQREGGRLNVMKLAKLVYLLDRLSIAKRGIPVVGGVYFSMKNGPVTSELLDIINAGKLADDESSTWEDLISDRKGHLVELRKADIPIEFISEAEIRLIDEIYREHGTKDQWQIRDWCHQHCGEWTSLQSGRAIIGVEQIAENVGKTPAEVERIIEESRESNLLASVFSAHGE